MISRNDKAIVLPCGSKSVPMEMTAQPFRCERHGLRFDSDKGCSICGNCPECGVRKITVGCDTGTKVYDCNCQQTTQVNL